VAVVWVTRPRTRLTVSPKADFKLTARTPAAILGRINAPGAETAVKEWIEKFGITDPEQQLRLVARPVK
jgi:hypothetical protein